MKLNKLILTCSLWLFWSVIYIIASEISEQLNQVSAEIDVVWFPAGVTIVALITSAKRQWPIYFVLFSLINVYYLSEYFDYGYLIVLFINVMALITPFIIATIVSYFSELQSQFNNLMMWIFTTMFICAINNAFGYLLLYLWGYDEPISDFVSSWIADVSGIIYATTALLGLTTYKKWKQRLSTYNVIVSFISLCLMMISAWFVFAEPIESLKYTITNNFGATFNILLACVPIIFVIIITLFLNGLGRTISLLVLGFITIFYTNQNMGPFFLPGLNTDEPLIIAQVYLSSIAILCLLISILTTTQRFGLKTRSKKCLIRYQLYPEDQKIIFDYLIEQITPLQKKSILQDVLEHIEKQDHIKLKQHWLQRDITNGDAVSFQLKNGVNSTMKIKDRILMVMNNQNKTMLLGEWEILNCDVISNNAADQRHNPA